MKIFGSNGMERTATVSSLPILVFTLSSPLARLSQYVLDCLRTFCHSLCFSILSLFTEISKNEEVLEVLCLVA